MKIIKKLMTKNDCYKAGKKITPKGIVVHSTATPKVMAKDWFSRWNKSGIAKCVHAFLDDKEIWQYLEWNHRAWHCGGKGNDLFISFEICEPADLKDKEYFNKAYKNAVDLSVYLCEKYNLTEKVIMDHTEAHKKGYASNHGDVMHWFPKHGKNMDIFREDVKKALAAATAPKPEPKKEEKKKAAKYGKVTANVLNVRSGRGTDYKVIGKLEDGKKVKLLYLQDGWWSIDVPMEWSRTGVGFVSADYIKEVK